MKDLTKYCGPCGKRTTPRNRRKSPIGRKVTCCESCRRKLAKAQATTA